MSLTRPSDISAQQIDVWSADFTKQLRDTLLLGSLVNKDYSGQISKQGDTVKVSQINAPTGSLLTVGTDSDSFTTEQISTTQVEVSANKRAVAAYEVEDLTWLQTQLDSENSEVRDSLVYAVAKQMNDYLYTLVAPSTSNPDHDVSSVTDFNAAQLSAVRLLASSAKWDRTKPWYLLADPTYYSDILDDTTLASADYGATDRPIVAGQLALPRMGFNILEDNSRSTDFALAFHPDFLLMVMQKSMNIKISDLHSNKQFGWVISADVVFGAKLGIDGAKKHIKIYNS